MDPTVLLLETIEIGRGVQAHEMRDDGREALQGQDRLLDEKEERVPRRLLTALDFDGMCHQIIEILLNVGMDKVILLEGEGGLEVRLIRILLEEGIKVDHRIQITITIPLKELLQA